MENEACSNETGLHCGEPLPPQSTHMVKCHWKIHTQSYSSGEFECPSPPNTPQKHRHAYFSAMWYLSAMCFHTVSFVGHKLDNGFASLLIFRFEWHSREFFQLSWSHLYFLYLQRCRWGTQSYHSISKGGHIMQHFYPSLMEQLLFLSFLLSLSLSPPLVRNPLN